MSAARFCVNCGSPLQAGARFCGGCGRPLGQDSAAQPPVPNLPQQPAVPPAPTAAPVRRVLPNPSDVVFLFGDSFVSKDNWRSEGYVLESNGAKVQKSPLAQTMLLAAVAALVKGGWIDLQIVKMGALVFKQDVPVLRRLSSEPCRLGGLEGAMLDRISGMGDQANSVGHVVGRLVGSDQDDPWENVLAYSRAHLVECGHLRQTENPSAHGLGKLLHSRYVYEPNTTLVMESQVRINDIRGLMDSLRSSRGKAWELAGRQIEQTLKAAKATSDDGGDSGDSGDSGGGD